MELSERCIQTLEKEGFVNIFEEQDAPEAIYPEHSHKEKVAIFITEGSIEITVLGVVKLLGAGDRFNFPPNTPYSIIVGKNGCQFVIGEMNEGDF